MVLKQNGVHFVHCPQQGNKIEGVVLNRVCILGILCPKQGQGFKLLFVCGYWGLKGVKYELAWELSLHLR